MHIQVSLLVLRCFDALRQLRIVRRYVSVPVIHGDITNAQPVRQLQQRFLWSSGCAHPHGAVRSRDRCAHLSALAAYFGADMVHDSGACVAFDLRQRSVVPG